jgi:DNA-binding NarL/FixJ family response regulator
MSDRRVKVIVVDDQALVREGLLTLLATVDGIETVGSAADGLDATTLCAQHQPDVVLMDLRMPVLDGVKATKRIKNAHPQTEVVVLTTHADDASIFEALQAGALGYLTKDAGITEISRAVFAAADHQALLDPQVQARLLAAATSGRSAAGPGSPAGPAASMSASGTAESGGGGDSATQPPPADDLTRRELEVLKLIANGLSNQEIAQQLFVSEATVKTHINHVFAKTGARDRAQAVHYAYSHGLAG